MSSIQTSRLNRRSFTRSAAGLAGIGLGLPFLEETGAAPRTMQDDANVTVISSADDRPWIEHVNAQYQEMQGGLIEAITPAYDQLHNQIVTALAGGSEIDVVIVDTIWGAEFAEAGFLQPIDQYLTQEMTDALVPRALDPWHYEGQQWAAPMSYYFKFYYYNHDMLERGGIDAPPATYEELVEVSQHLMNEGIVRHGQSWGWAQAEGLICDWQQLLHAFGGDWWDETGNWAFNQEPAVMALQYMVDNLASGVFDPASITLNDRTTMNVFARGDTAFMTNWGFAWSLVNDPAESQVTGQVSLSLNPGTRVANVVSTSCGGGGGFGVTANSQNQDAAWEVVGLLTSLTRPENDVTKLEMVGAPPIHQTVWEDPAVLAENPHFAEIIKQAPYMRHRPVLPWYTEFSRIVQIELSAALSGQKEPQQALDDAVAAVSSRGEPPVS